MFLSSWTLKLWSWRMNAEEGIMSGKMGDIWRPFLCNREPESCKGTTGDRSSKRFQIKRRTQWLTQRFQEGFIPCCALTAVLNNLCESCSPLFPAQPKSSPAASVPAVVEQMFLTPQCSESRMPGRRRAKSLTRTAAVTHGRLENSKPFHRSFKHTLRFHKLFWLCFPTSFW